MSQQHTFYFSEGPYLQALQGLHAALSVPEAFVKLLGGAQTGKSALCAKLAQYMRRKGFQVIYFDAAVESPEMLRTLLARELKLPVSSNFSRLLEDTLELQDDKPIILIFDDAHLLTDITLLEIYRLAEVQVNQSRVLNVLLSGEPELEKRLLSNREFKSLLLNISNRFVLESMDRATMDQFFYRFAEKSGIPGLQLDLPAMNYLYKSCRGYPGPALSMCRLIVESRLGSSDIRPIPRSDVMLLLKHAADQGLAGNVFGDAKKMKALAPLAAVVAIASIGFMYQQLQSTEQTSDSGDGLVQLGTDSPFQDAAGGIAGVADAELADGDAGEPAQAPTSSDVEIPLNDIDPAPENTPLVAADLLAANGVLPQPEPTEIPEPVSDSSLALVTAEEIGIAAGAISEPVFESLVAEEAERESRALAAEAAVVREDPVVSPGDDVPAVPPEPVPEPESTGLTIVAAGAIGSELEQPVVSAPVDVQDTLALNDEGDGEADQLAVGSASPADDSIELSLSEKLESSVQNWLSAWESQSLESYFASYHSRFDPRYHDDYAAWRNNRQRVIGNADSIELEMSEFEHIGLEEGFQDVRFWLRYQSPNYSDNTQKKLLLELEDGRWKIVEEINLQVRR